MRALALASFLLVITGCAADTLDNTTYRRLVDGFDSENQCLAEGDFSPCYHTLTFCDDGRVNANLEFRQEGTYKLLGDQAVARLLTATVYFDLDKQMSPDLPGRHPWQVFEPLQPDCATH